MAGTGHKLWATGDLISAAAFNTYIQDQVVGVYADSSARDAAFGGGGEPTLAEGLVAFLKDTNILTVYSGSAWIEVLDIDLFNTSNIELNKDSGSAYIKLTSAHDTEATTPFLAFRKADGTVASPALVDDNAVLGTLSFQGYDGNSYATGARIKAVADGTPADGDMPTELIFQVTPDGGSETPVTALTIRPSGESRFTADQDTTDFTSADPGIVSLFNTDGLDRQWSSTCCSYWPQIHRRRSANSHGSLEHLRLRDHTHMLDFEWDGKCRSCRSTQQRLRNV